MYVFCRDVESGVPFDRYRFAGKAISLQTETPDTSNGVLVLRLVKNEFRYSVGTQRDISCNIMFNYHTRNAVSIPQKRP